MNDEGPERFVIGSEDREERRRYWQAKLRPIRLNGVPIAEQWAKRRDVVLVLTGVSCGIMAIVFGLIAGFGRPDIGLIAVSIFLAPILSVAWCEFALLTFRVRGYRREIEQGEMMETSSEPGRS